MISVSDLSHAYGDRTLFSGVTLTLSAGRRYGLVGANGSGKTTLLRILAGALPPTKGTVTVPRRARVGFLDQDATAPVAERVLDVVVGGVPGLADAFAAREAALAGAFDATPFAEAEETIARLDGWSMEARAGEILAGLGIPEPAHHGPLSALSGGFRLRVLLARTLAASPDVLLLDEPTNHLDIVSIRWLEKFLSASPACVVVVSHDRRFLDNVATTILDVDGGTVTSYPGGWSDFEVAKAAARERLEAAGEAADKEIARQMEFVDRFRAKASKAKAVQSRIKAIEKIERAAPPSTSRRRPAFRFEVARPGGKIVLRARGIAKAYGAKPVLAGVSLEVRRGERVAVIGANGLGKSTLLKILVGVLEADAGAVAWGHGAEPGWFPQDHKEVLGARKTALEWLAEACPGEGIGALRSALGAALLGGDAAEKRVEALSGGEGARLLFARLALQQPNALVLDEPTNHLDLESTEALADAIAAYAGTAVFVSHDRWLVERLATRILEVTTDGVRDFHGGYAAYVAWRGDDLLDRDRALAAAKGPKAAKGGGDGKGAGGRAARPAGPDPRAIRKAATAARAARDTALQAVVGAEERLAVLHAKLADPLLYRARDPNAPGPRLGDLRAEERAAADAVARAIAAWEAAERELARAESEAAALGAS